MFACWHFLKLISTTFQFKVNFNIFVCGSKWVNSRTEELLQFYGFFCEVWIYLDLNFQTEFFSFSYMYNANSQRDKLEIWILASKKCSEKKSLPFFHVCVDISAVDSDFFLFSFFPFPHIITPFFWFRDVQRNLHH